LIETLGLDPSTLPEQMDRVHWPAMRNRFAEMFKPRTRDEWFDIMEGADICFAPVLSYREAHAHPHNKARGSFVEVDGIIQLGPVPRFSRTPANVKHGPLTSVHGERMRLPPGVCRQRRLNA